MQAGRPWNGPEDQLAADVAIEADPVDVGQVLKMSAAGVGHVGDGVGLPRDQPFERGRGRAHDRLVVGVDLEMDSSSAAAELVSGPIF